MITLNDVAQIIINPSCEENTYPCRHTSTIILTNGRSASNLNNSQIWIIISSLADEKINPGMNFTPRLVKLHFKQYESQPTSTVTGVLNQIFPPKKEAFNMNQTWVKASEFSEGSEELLGYILTALNSDTFKKDPENYYSNWMNEIGHTVGRKWPEAKAGEFFKQNFK